MLHLHLEKQPQSALSFQVTLKCRSLGLPKSILSGRQYSIFLCPKVQTYTDHLLHELPSTSEQTQTDKFESNGTGFFPGFKIGTTFVRYQLSGTTTVLRM
jgi:hypothetical protein